MQQDTETIIRGMLLALTLILLIKIVLVGIKQFSGKKR